MDQQMIDRFASDLQQQRLDRRQFLLSGLRAAAAGGALAALLTGAPSAGASPRAGSLRRSLRTASGSNTFTALMAYGIEDIDPHSAYGAYGPLVMRGLYEPLLCYRAETTSEYEPVLAESWEISADQTTYTFHLAPNVLFHDGTSCDAQAVKSSFTRCLQLGLGPVDVVRRFVADPNQIEAVDPLTVRFNLGNPQPLFLAAMACGYGPYVVSPTAIEENKTDNDPWAHEWFLANAVGTGPYRLSENEFNERIVLSRFDEYRRGWDDSRFEEVLLRVVEENGTRRQLLEQGDADALAYYLTPEDVESLKSDADLQVLTYDTTRVNWTVMNGVTMSPEARRGFSYAFPYDDVVNGVYKGLLKRSGPIPDTVRGFDPGVFLYSTDLAKAKELILAGGFAEGDGFEYVVAAGSPVEQTIAQLFQANLQSIGFNLEIVALDGASIESIVFGDAPPEEQPHFIGWAWWPDYNDPWSHLAPNFLQSRIGNGGGNAGRWVNPRFEEIMAEAEHYTDEARLAELMQEAQNILTEQDPPVIYQGQVKYYTILQKEIQGFIPNPLYLEAYPFYEMTRAAE